MMGAMNRLVLLVVAIIFVTSTIKITSSSSVTTSSSSSLSTDDIDAIPLPKIPDSKLDGYDHYNIANELYDKEQYEESAYHYWLSYEMHGIEKVPNATRDYEAGRAYSQFLHCYHKLNKFVNGLAYISLQYFRIGKNDMGRELYDQAMSVDPTNDELKKVKHMYALEIEHTIPDTFVELHHTDHNDNHPDSETYNKPLSELDDEL